MKRDTLKLLAAVLLLLCVPFAAVAFDSSALPGPAGSAAFTATGGTVTQPVVFTGDNANGTGTVRIRPSDEDTQLVICDASNNSSPEVCSSWQHYNSSVASSASFYATNLYVDSAGATQVYASAFGSGYFQTAGTTTAGVTYFGVRAPAAAANTANYVLECRSTGATTATCTWGSGHTTTMDTRGPELNGGAAACGSSSVTGGKCITDDTLMLTDANAVFYARTTGTTGTAATVYGATSFASSLQAGWYGSSADADYASSPAILSVGGTTMNIVQTSDIGAASPAFAFKDNTAASGATLLEIEGGGELDVRGAVKNEGSATCNGVNAGSVCFNDQPVFYADTAIFDLSIGSSNAASSARVMEYTQGTAGQATTIFNTGAMTAGSPVGAVGYYGSTYSDADYADDVTLTGVSKELSFIRTDNVGAASIHTKWTEDASASATLAGTTLMTLLGDGTVKPTMYGSQSNCSDGAGAAACSAAPAGSVVIDDGATTVVVSTTAVTANSQILVTFDSSLGTKLGVTCNTTYVDPYVTARTAATSFTITAADPAGANPVCLSYFVVN